MSTTNASLRSAFAQLKEAFIGSATAPLELPALQGPLLPREVCHAAGVARLAELGRQQVHEVTVTELMDDAHLAQALRDAIESSQLLWVVRIESDHLVEEISTRYPALVHPLNAERTAWGINVFRLVSRLLAVEPAMRRVLDGVNVTWAPMKMRTLLHEHGIPVTRAGVWHRVVRDPRTWVYLAIFVYSSLRALPVVLVPQFHGSVAVLWTIDVVTAIPYTWGVLAMVTATRTRIRVLGAVTTIVTFVAPYVYFWAHGKNYPPSVQIIVALMIVASIAIESMRFAQEKRLVRLYEAE